MNKAIFFISLFISMGCNQINKNLYVYNYKEIFNIRIRDSSCHKILIGEYYRDNVTALSCFEDSGFVELISGGTGAVFKSQCNDVNCIYDFLIHPVGSYEGKYGFDTIRYIIPRKLVNCLRITKQKKFEYINGKIISFTWDIDTLKINFIDTLVFKYACYNYVIYKFDGEFKNGGCGTFFISNYYGVFKEYLPIEDFSYQRDILPSDQDYEIYMTHLYYLFSNQKFHTRCDNGPLWLFPSSYIKSNKPRCNLNEWPKK